MRPMTFNRKRIHSFHILLAACLLIVSVGAANLSAGASAETRITGISSDSTSLVNASMLNSGIGIHEVGLLYEGTGWAWIDSRIYLTVDNGASWSDLTPPELAGARILDAHFSADGISRILSVVADAFGAMQLQITISNPFENNWRTIPVHLLTPDQPGFDPAEGSMFWLDENNAWISIRFRSSSSVSTGTSFRTGDGGNSWQELPLPSGDPLAFSSSQVGWQAGGAAGDELYRSLDGGSSWQFFIPSGLPGVIVRTFLPIFEGNETGLLPILVHDAGQYQLIFYESSDGGVNWSAPGSIPLGTGFDPDGIRVSAAAPNHVSVIDPSGTFFNLNEGLVTSLDLSQTLAGITFLDILDLQHGWALSDVQDCIPAAGVPVNSDGKGTYNCRETTRLLSTADGGSTWQTLPLPTGMGSAIVQETQVVPNLATDAFTIQSNEVRITTQGFDACVPGSVGGMQDWWNKSPYYASNMYIGGDNRGCDAVNEATISKTYIATLRDQGWYFIPTWVGLQASCSTGNFWKMSSNTTTAYNQGVTEANNASDVMASLGFTGSIVYFDLEAYDMSNIACVNAARAFVNGWTVQLHNRGYLSGLYAMAYKVDNYYTIANRPDGIWMAGGGTNYSSYNPAATVWGNKYVSDDLWSGVNRIYQYTSGHYETYGSTSMNVDSDAINGIVAVPGTQPSCPAPTLVSPADGFVSPGQTINFSWQMSTGCTFKDYTIRIKTVADMSSGGTTIYDATTDQTSRSVTIDAQWNGQDLYWGVRTDFPYSAEWSVRRFSIGINLACSITDDQAALFAGVNYSGDCVVRNIGDYPNASTMELADNSVSSVLVGANVSLKLCRDANYSDTCESFYKDDPDLSNNSIGNDQASSAKVAALPVSVTLFADAGYGGASCQLKGVGWNNACTSLDNLGSSLKVLSGWSARVWSNPDLKGESRCFTSDVSTFSGLYYNENGGSAMDNTVSSFAAYDQPTCPPLLTITVNGSGTGTVTSDPAGINCGSACAAAFADGSTVTLTGVASSGSTFTGWSGGVCSGASPCQVKMSEARNVTATFTANAYTLNIVKTGSGTISSSPSGLNCGPVCSYSYPYNTTVTLYKAATTGSNFSSWGGACTGSGACSVLMNGDKTVNANFVYDINTLNVSKTGTGSGTVTSSPGGIDCGADCSGQFTYPTTVKLTAVPLSGSTFTGWSGYCSGTGVCSVPMTAGRSVTASFAAGAGFTLNVSKTGTGSGTVSSSPAGINCGGTCSFSFTQNAQVTLSAVPSSNNDKFNGWSGACTGMGTCTVTMSESRSVTASFTHTVFDDVPFDYTRTLGGVSYNLHDYIQVLYEHGLTIGTSTNPPLFSPALQLDRAMTAVFMLRGQYGSAYEPPLEPYDAFGADDWSLNDWARPWAEGMWDAGLTAGCLSEPLMYCPDDTLPRVQAVIFGLRMKYDYLDGEGKLVAYQPPAATGTVFADLTDVNYYGTAWAEQAYLDGLLPACGESGGKPLFCPDDPLDRAWAAYLIVKAKGLTLP